MTLLDPAERSRRGAENQAELLATPPSAPGTLFESSWRDFIYAEIWARPGLDRRSRYIIAMCGAACAHDAATVETYVRGALVNTEFTLAELREAVLHLAVYAGWSEGAIFDAAVTRVATALGLAPAACDPIRATPWDPQVRLEEGRANFEKTMTISSPRSDAAYIEGGIVNFVFGEMWSRPGLDERARRWITLTGVANSSSSTPIRSHTYAALASGNASREEMFEFVLQYAVHGGWPKASVMQGAVIEMADRVEKGLKFEA
ncbi:MAG TPA: carboxymuconolactone decarboxylase family protein [Acetobacteraceae bacterium]|nr:carboxymuconolactone decarboxylase family protein [Acetobacteraceae bacterium]